AKWRSSRMGRDWPVMPTIHEPNPTYAVPKSLSEKFYNLGPFPVGYSAFFSTDHRESTVANPRVVKTNPLAIGYLIRMLRVCTCGVVFGRSKTSGTRIGRS